MTFPSSDLPLSCELGAKLADEATCVEALIDILTRPAAEETAIARRARRLVEGVRENRQRFGGLDDFLEEYELTTPEGVALMCLAEALLRIPDSETADRLIADKIGGANWQAHLGRSESWFVNASTLALMLTGRVVEDDPLARQDGRSVLSRLISRAGEPVIREAVRRAMRVLGRQFVMGRDIDEALARAEDDRRGGYTHSFDMLGEGARTAGDAARYFESYSHAIEAIAAAAAGMGPRDAPGVSVKLSALHPRYEFARREDAVPALADRLGELARACRAADIGLTVDAEEADRLDMSVEIFTQVLRDPALASWEGFGLAVQAYQKRAIHLVTHIVELARETGRRVPVRLVKGAYWDSEIKWAQEKGLSGYPVFTRKSSTDVSYLACASRLLDAPDAVYPMFATHNAHTVAAVMHMADNPSGYEFQRLHGMGEPLYHQIVSPDSADSVACRIYAPVGSHKDLLPYLVRRLLENGANSSFVNRLRDDAAPIDGIVADPVEVTRGLDQIPHPRIPLPENIYGPERRNAAGMDLTDPVVVGELYAGMSDAPQTGYIAQPLIAGDARANGAPRPVLNPADRSQQVGEVWAADAAMVDAAFEAGREGFAAWSAYSADDRATVLERVADLLEEHRYELMALAIREAGKTVPDALAEVREAVDFSRYYAARAREQFAGSVALPGPTGESNKISLHGRGVFVCISPWNFPLAIFTGQVTAALAAGNAVIAKPAEQTPLIAMRTVCLMQEAGVPPEALAFMPGGGDIGAALVAHRDVAGVAFTGSTETARAINRVLADKNGPIVPLIAETGGQNAMIVDASALPEQVVDDAITSGIGSAGQRCSALRLMFLQEDVADRIVELFRGACAELVVGDPWELSTDVGPVIDEDARATLVAHARKMAAAGRTLVDLPTGPGCAQGTFFGPKVFEIDDASILTREVFGPIVHVVRYAADRLNDVVDAVNATGYGLTLGVHSRIETTQRAILERARVGNAYVNRSMIGAIVGVQPFGGEGLSGTGPKAGGPHYLPRFAVERTVSVNTAAAGGNTALMTMDD